MAPELSPGCLRETSSSSSSSSIRRRRKLNWNILVEMGRLCYGSSSSSSSGVVQVSSHHTPDWHRARPWMVPQNRFAARRCCFRLTPWSAIEWHSNGPRDTLHMTSFTGNATGRSLHIRKRTTTESSGWHQQLRTPVMGNLTRGSFIIRCLLVEKALEKMCSKFDKISNIYKKKHFLP